MFFNIQRYSTHDGTGIRTNIFFKGCPLRCKYCANPESQKDEPDLFFHAGRCIGCRTCVGLSRNGEFTAEHGAVSFHREVLRDAEIFRDICPARAIEVVGGESSVGEILEIVMKDLPYFGDNGGVTLSGGEPFWQPALAEELTRALKQRGISVDVETALHVPWENIRRSLSNIDVFLADLKTTDPAKFKAFTGGNLELVISNFKKLKENGASVIYRVPVIHGFNDSRADMEPIIRFAAELKAGTEINFLPFHSFGKGKYDLLEREYKTEEMAVNESGIFPFIQYAEQLGLKTSLGG